MKLNLEQECSRVMQVNPRSKETGLHNNSEKITIKHRQDHAKGVEEPGFLDKIAMKNPYCDMFSL